MKEVKGVIPENILERTFQQSKSLHFPVVPRDSRSVIVAG